MVDPVPPKPSQPHPGVDRRALATARERRVATSEFVWHSRVRSGRARGATTRSFEIEATRAARDWLGEPTDHRFGGALLHVWEIPDGENGIIVARLSGRDVKQHETVSGRSMTCSTSASVVRSSPGTTDAQQRVQGLPATARDVLEERGFKISHDKLRVLQQDRIYADGGWSVSYKGVDYPGPTIPLPDPVPLGRRAAARGDVQDGSAEQEQRRSGTAWGMEAQ
jgi:hypothetical protein